MRAGIFLILLLVTLHAPTLAAAEDARLIKIVALSRHGVRAPTQDARILSLWSEKTWPVWPVERGYLTPRGARLVTSMWQGLKPSLAARGIMPESGRFSKELVYIRADVDERTRATAEAIVEGLCKDCGLGYAVEDVKIDPLFHPVKAGLYRYDAITTAMSVIKRSHGGLENMQEELSGAIDLISEISGAPAPSICARFALMPKCKLEDLPNAVSVSPDGKNIHIVGSLGIASSLAEIFLLEYGEWPNEAAGWGKVDARALAQIMPAHTKVFDLVNRSSIVAWANGSSLLSEMTSALFGEHKNSRINDARLVIYVGHDTNIANVAGLLDIDWQPSGYPPNGIPPAGVLFLELWQDGGNLEVRGRFYSQTPAVLHKPFEQNEGILSHAPASAIVKSNQQPLVMSAAEFRELVRSKTAGAPLALPQDPGFEYGKAN